MKHSVRELVKVNGKGYYTQEYVEVNGIPQARTFGAGNSGWQTVLWVNQKKGVIKIQTPTQVITGYLYGEKTWFDTEAERDEYRAACLAERAEAAYRKQLLENIMAQYAQLDTAELEKIIANRG